MSYKVKLNIFEGPFDLLVYLIESAEMSIYDIEISGITREYLAVIDEMKELNIAVASEFMVLAAELIDIKSKMILPRSSPDEAGLSIEEDPRADLAKRLMEYKRFKAASELLAEYEEENLLVFEKPKEDISAFLNRPDEYLSLGMEQFVEAFRLFLEKKQREEEVRKHYTYLERDRSNTEAKMAFIRQAFMRRGIKRLRMSELFEERGKYETILTFTSLLEMARQHEVDMQQKESYGEIIVEDLHDNA